jgi:hypothetical protein
MTAPTPRRLDDVVDRLAETHGTETFSPRHIRRAVKHVYEVDGNVLPTKYLNRTIRHDRIERVDRREFRVVPARASQ